MTAKQDESFQVVLVDDVVSDESWNLRSGKWKEATTKDGEMSFEQLCTSILFKGQDDPVKVRPKGKKFELLAGFRRTAAIRKLAKDKQSPPKDTDPETLKALQLFKPEIKVIVKNVDDTEARSLNIRENSRDPIAPPDLAWALFDLFQRKIASTKQEPTDRAIAAEVGLSEGYVNQLLTVMRKVHPKVTKLWREATVQLSIADMRAIGEEKDKNLHFDMYHKKLQAKENTTKGPGSWITTSIKQAERVGQLLGTLKREGVIQVAESKIGERFDWLGIKVKEGASQTQIKAIAEALANSYMTATKEAASTGSLLESAEEDEDEDET